MHSFFKRQLIIVPNLRIGSVWTSPTTSEPKSGFFFKAGGDGVSYPIRGYTDAGIEACEGKENPSYGGMCDTVFPVGVTAADGLVDPERVGGHAMILGSLETRFPTFAMDDFWLAVFSDFGAIAPDWEDMELSRFRLSVGAGLRWLVSGQIHCVSISPIHSTQRRLAMNNSAHT